MVDRLILYLRIVGMLCLPQKQAVQLFDAHLPPGRAAMVALVGALGGLHLAQQGVHFVYGEASVGAHRSVAGHGA